MVSDNLLLVLSLAISKDRNICSAVLFGSHARLGSDAARADEWSDLDLHLIVCDIDKVVNQDWAQIFKQWDYCLKVLRPATGGVKKLTILFREAEIDIVLVQRFPAALGKCAMALGLHKRSQVISGKLNAMSTVMSGGYRFIKGEKQWGTFYARVVAEMPGIRFSDSVVMTMADSFICEYLSVTKKIERGELIAAQRILHHALIETNVVLLHELRMRAGSRTYQQARRVEILLPRSELSAIQCSAHLESEELKRAALKSLMGLKFLMEKLLPRWHIPLNLAYQHLEDENDITKAEQ